MAVYGVYYYGEHGPSHTVEAFDTLDKAIADIAAEMASPQMTGFTLVEVEGPRNRVIMMFDRDGLQHVDLIGTINLLGSEPYFGGTRDD